MIKHPKKATLWTFEVLTDLFWNFYGKLELVKVKNVYPEVTIYCGMFYQEVQIIFWWNLLIHLIIFHLIILFCISKQKIWVNTRVWKSYKEIPPLFSLFLKMLETWFSFGPFNFQWQREKRQESFVLYQWKHTFHCTLSKKWGC